MVNDQVERIEFETRRRAGPPKTVIIILAFAIALAAVLVFAGVLG